MTAFVVVANEQHATPRRLRNRTIDEVLEGRVGDEHLRTRVREDPRELVALEMPVDRKEAGLDAAGRRGRLEELEAVRHHRCDRAGAIARHTEVVQDRGEAGGAVARGRHTFERRRPTPSPPCRASPGRARPSPIGPPKHPDTRVRYAPARMREHRYTLDMPHSAARLWALFQDYDNWTEYAPMVLEVEVVHPGDQHGNGLLRRVIYQMPLGRKGAALELVTDVAKERGYTFTMLSHKPGNDQTGKVRLEPLGPNQTRFHFEERYHLTRAPWKWFEGRIYGFINKKNEETMRRRRSGSPTIPSTGRTWSTEKSTPRRRRDDHARTRCRRRSTGRRACWRSTSVATPEVGPHDVLLEVTHCGVCGSDLHMVLEGWGRPTPSRATSTPASSSRSATGVTGWAVGDRVVAGPSRRCGECEPCRAGRPSLCLRAGRRRHGRLPGRLRPLLADPRGRDAGPARRADACARRRWPSRWPSPSTASPRPRSSPGTG